MKHILNDLSEKEKKYILEQYKGEIKVVSENFNKLVNSKLGDAKPIINEALGGSAPQRVQKSTSTFIPGETKQLGKNLFKLGSDEINTNSQEFKNALSEIQKAINDPNMSINSITVQGGASSAGSNRGYDNKALANRRANNFKKALENNGIKTNIKVTNGIVTPNTDIPNSPEANNAQFVRFTINTPSSSTQDFESAIDNATLKLQFPYGAENQKIDTKDFYHMTLKITYRKNQTYRKILDMVKKCLEGVAIKVEDITANRPQSHTLDGGVK